MQKIETKVVPQRPSACMAAPPIANENKVILLHYSKGQAINKTSRIRTIIATLTLLSCSASAFWLSVGYDVFS